MGVRENLATALTFQTILITGGDLTITIYVTVIVVLLIPTMCLSCAGTKYDPIKVVPTLPSINQPLVEIAFLADTTKQSQ